MFSFSSYTRIFNAVLCFRAKASDVCEFGGGICSAEDRRFRRADGGGFGSADDGGFGIQRGCHTGVGAAGADGRDAAPSAYVLLFLLLICIYTYVTFYTSPSRDAVWIYSLISSMSWIYTAVFTLFLQHPGLTAPAPTHC